MKRMMTRVAGMAVALMGLAAAGAAPAAAAVPPVDFAPHTDYAVNNEPSDIAVGDFNGDGLQDLVAANGETDDVSVLIGTGTGSFLPATHFAAGDFPVAVRVGDFNGDGHQDLVTGNVWTDDIAVLLGTGTGSFGPPSSVRPAMPPGMVLFGQHDLGMVLGDFNHDGAQDIAVTGPGCVWVLFGTGTGSFSLGDRCHGLGYEANGMTVGDFNGDGELDLATALGSEFFGIAVLIGTSSGSFEEAVTYLLQVDTADVAVGDFDGDGHQDLVTANGNDFGNDVSVLLGDGSGAFATPVHFPSHSGFDVAVGEFNGDGYQDLVTVGGHLSDAASVLLGTGTGSFSPSTQFPLDTGGYAYKVAVADFNGDGRQDVATANSRHNDVSVLLNVAPPRMSILDASRAEGGSGTPSVYVTVTLDGASEQTVTARFKTRDGTAVAGVDYVPKEGIVSFAPGETSATFKLSTIGDMKVELTEYFFVGLSRVSGAAVADRTARITLRNDDR